MDDWIRQVSDDGSSEQTPTGNGMHFDIPNQAREGTAEETALYSPWKAMRRQLAPAPWAPRSCCLAAFQARVRHVWAD